MDKIPEIEYYNGRAVCALRGDLNLYQVGPLKRLLMTELERTRDRLESLEFLMEEVNTIDSSMLALIYQMQKIFKARGKIFLLRRPSRNVLAVLNITALDQHIQIELD